MPTTPKKTAPKAASAPKAPAETAPTAAAEASPTVAERLAPFAGIIAAGDVTLDRIAEMAGVTVDEILAETGKSSAPETPDEPAKTPKGGRANAPKAETRPPAEAPSCIRAVRSFRTTKASGAPWDIGMRDVYSGETAADLWTRHAEHFEAFPVGV